MKESDIISPTSSSFLPPISFLLLSEADLDASLFCRRFNKL